MQSIITTATCRPVGRLVNKAQELPTSLACALTCSRSFAVKKNKKGDTTVKEEGGRDRITELLIRAFDAPVETPPPASEEEMSRRHEVGRNYVIGCFNRHNEINHDLNCKLRMKNHAIDMLPRNSWIKDEALKVSDDEDTLPPIWRSIPFDTPPIPGFDPSDFILEDEEKK